MASARPAVVRDERPGVGVARGEKPHHVLDLALEPVRGRDLGRHRWEVWIAGVDRALEGEHGVLLCHREEIAEAKVAVWLALVEGERRDERAAPPAHGPRDLGEPRGGDRHPLLPSAAWLGLDRGVREALAQAPQHVIERQWRGASASGHDRPPFGKAPRVSRTAFTA